MEPLNKPAITIDRAAELSGSTRASLQFDIKTFLSAMPRRPAIDFASAARRFGVCARTCRRWHAAGADLADPASVAAVILRMKRPAIKALKNLEKLLP